MTENDNDLDRAPQEPQHEPHWPPLSYFYDKDGKPVHSMEHAEKLLRDLAYKRVGDDQVAGCRVSTVWLGIDHGFNMLRDKDTPTDDYKPIIFETMIFGGPHDKYQERYQTLEQAKKGHERIVQRLSQGLDPD